MSRVWWAGYVIGVRIGRRMLVWDALTARAIRKSKEVRW